AQTLASPIDINRVADASDLTLAELEHLAQTFAEADHPVATPGGALPGESYTLEAMKAIQVLNEIVGIDGQPGGKGSASQASQLPPSPAGYSTLGDVMDLIDRMKNHQVQVLMVNGANPVYDLPDQAGFTDALQNVPYVVSFAPIVDETAVQADLILPDRTYLESWGYEIVSPSFGTPVVGSQQPVVEPLFDNRSTADVLLTVARGIPEASKALPWKDEVAYLKEKTASLPATEPGVKQLEVRWERFLQHGGWWSGGETAAPTSAALPSRLESAQPVLFSGDQSEFPYFLHLFMTDLLSDGRGANQPWLQGSPDTNTTISWQTWVELNPATAANLNLQAGDLVQVASPFGEIVAPIYPYPGIRPDTVGIPLGQGHTDYGRYARDRGSNPVKLLGIQVQQAGDQPDWSVPRVKITPTGSRINLATFEYATDEGNQFINKDSPG
ncbi:MAG: molybdopterin dinucleotide binding domain-containing protein, partial [Anaerolineales bacterium]